MFFFTFLNVTFKTLKVIHIAGTVFSMNSAALDRLSYSMKSLALVFTSGGEEDEGQCGQKRKTSNLKINPNLTMGF